MHQHAPPQMQPPSAHMQQPRMQQLQMQMLQPRQPLMPSDALLLQHGASATPVQPQGAPCSGLGTPPAKPILFYSQYCRFSCEIVEHLVKRDLRSRFVLVCVDTHRTQVPAFVDRVPLILTTARQVLTDERVMEYIAGCHEPSSDPVAAEFAKGDFEFMDNSGTAQHQTDAVFGYLSLDGLAPDSFPRIFEGAPPADDSLHRKSGGGRSDAATMAPGEGSALDRLIAERDNSLHAWTQSQQPRPA